MVHWSTALIWGLGQLGFDFLLPHWFAGCPWAALSLSASVPHLYNGGNGISLPHRGRVRINTWKIVRCWDTAVWISEREGEKITQMGSFAYFFIKKDDQPKDQSLKLEPIPARIYTHKPIEFSATIQVQKVKHLHKQDCGLNLPPSITQWAVLCEGGILDTQYILNPAGLHRIYISLFVLTFQSQPSIKSEIAVSCTGQRCARSHIG